MTLTGARLAAAASPLGISRSDLVEADKIESDSTQDDLLFHRFEGRGADFTGLADPEMQTRLSTLDAELKSVGHVAIRLGHEPQGDVVVCYGDPPPDGSPQRPSRDLKLFAEDLDAQVRTPYAVEILVNKTALAAKVAGKAVGRDRRVFLFIQALIDILVAGSESAARLWAKPAEPIVVAVFDDEELEAQGELLRIVAGSKIASEPLSYLPTGRDTSRVSTCRKDYISWAREWSHDVTPLHYQVDFTVGADSRIAAALAGQMAMLTVLHVCDRARIARADRPTVITADFRGGSHAASIQFDDRGTTRRWKKSETASLGELVEWIYRPPATERARDWMFDRLQFAQITIARMLEIAQSTHATQTLLDGFVHISDGLSKRLEYQWETFVEGKLDDYAAKVSEMEQEAAEAVFKYNERVAAIVKSVAETALASVGVMVGTFIAAAFKAPFNGRLFEIGLTVYAGYVVVFPLLWGQASHAYQKRQLTRSRRARLKQLRAILSDAVDDNPVVDTAEGASRKFWVWWALACLVYIGIVIAALVAVEIVPARIVEGPAASSPSG